MNSDDIHSVLEGRSDLIEPVNIEEPEDILVIESGSEILAERGKETALLLLHEEDENIVRGRSEKLQYEDKDWVNEVKRRGPGGSVYHGDTDCLTISGPVEESTEVDDIWNQLTEFMKNKIDVPEHLLYENGRDILVRSGEEQDPENDPQALGIGIRTRPGDYFVARACSKGRSEATITPKLEELLELDGIELGNYQEKNYFLGDKGERLSETLSNSQSTRSVKDLLEDEGVYNEATRKASQTFNQSGISEPESCVLEYRRTS